MAIVLAKHSTFSMQLTGTGSALWSPRAFLRISGFSIVLGSLENVP